jgi:transposase
MDRLKAHYRLLLGLDTSWNVTDVALEVDEKRVTINLEFIGSGAVCPECSRKCGLMDHAPERKWRHLDTMQFETILKAAVPRTNCDTCGVKTASVPWAGKHSRFTLLFEAFAIDVLVCAGSVKSAAALLGIGWDAAHTIMERAVQRGLAERTLDGLRYVGIDEKSFGRGQDYVSVMTDQEGSRVIEVVPGRTEKSADLLWKALSKDQRAEIQAVSIDMCQAFENSIQSNAPQADIVFDRFHISKHLNEGVDQVRRSEHKTLKARGDDRLTGSRQLWLFNPENLSESRDKEFTALRKQQLKTSRAWGIKDYFRWFWTSSDAIAACEFFDEWYSWAIRSRLKPMKKVAVMLKKRLANILTWFTHSISSCPL